MRRLAIFAASMGGIVPSATFGNFTFSVGAPNRTVVPGKIALPLYALNNGNTGGNDTGTLLKAFNLIFSTTGGGIYVNADDSGTPGDNLDDTIDLPNAGGVSPTLSTPGNGKTYVRIGSAAQTFQVQVLPNDATPYNAPAGIFSFSVTEGTTANVNASSTVNGGLGFRAAVLVLNTNITTLTLSGQIGGDIGGAQTIAPQTFAFVPEPTTLAALAMAGVAAVRRRR